MRPAQIRVLCTGPRSDLPAPYPGLVPGYLDQFGRHRLCPDRLVAASLGPRTALVGCSERRVLSGSTMLFDYMRKALPVLLFLLASCTHRDRSIPTVGFADAFVDN